MVRDSNLRLRKFRAKENPDIIKDRYNAVRDISRVKVMGKIDRQVEIERQVKTMLQGVPTIQQHAYILFAKKFNKTKDNTERRITFNKWLSRGLDENILRKIAGLIFKWSPGPIMINSCDSLSDSLGNWYYAYGASPPTLNTTDKVQGCCSINMGKSNPGGPTKVSVYYKEVPEFDGRGQYIKVWYRDTYIWPLTASIELSRFTGSEGWYGHFYKIIEITDNKWHLFNMKIEDMDKFQVNGKDPDITKLNYILFYFVTTLPEDTIPNGGIKMDYWARDWVY